MWLELPAGRLDTPKKTRFQPRKAIVAIWARSFVQKKKIFF